MIDHIKLAEKHGYIATDCNGAHQITFNDDLLQAYTNAIHEYDAVKCDEIADKTERAPEDFAEAIRQEKV